MRAAGVLGRWGLPFQALAVFAFCTFAQLSSLVPVSAAKFDGTRWPTVGDLRREGEFATLCMTYSKTQQAADGGFLVPMHASNMPLCPVALAQALLDRATRLRLPLLTPLFAASGTGESEPFVSLSQGVARGFLQRYLKVLGLTHKAYFFHSFRRGGVLLPLREGHSRRTLRDMAAGAAQGSEIITQLICRGSASRMFWQEPGPLPPTTQNLAR